MKRRWSPIHCRQGWSRASSTANAPFTVGSGRLFFSRSWSSTSDGLSPTTQNCSAACSRSESGRSQSGSGMAAAVPNRNSGNTSPSEVCWCAMCNKTWRNQYIQYEHQPGLKFAIYFLMSVSHNILWYLSSVFLIASLSLWISRWIVQAMKHELKIRAGDMPPQDIYQLSPSDIKQLLLDVLQPQHTGRYSSNTQSLSQELSTLSHPLHLTDLPLKTPSLYLNAFTHIIFLALIILSSALSCLRLYLFICLCRNPISPWGIIKVLSYLV